LKNNFCYYRERQLAKERADRERLDMEKRKLKELELKQKMEKIKELVCQGLYVSGMITTN
jgi:hypothetical protein